MESPPSQSWEVWNCSDLDLDRPIEGLETGAESDVWVVNKISIDMGVRDEQMRMLV